MIKNNNKLPSKKQINFWLTKITKEKIKVNIVKVTKKKMLLINKKYRNKAKSTNILSFKYDNCKKNKYLGDIFVCPYIIEKKSIISKNKLLKEWCNTIIHGILHLLDYDHETTKEYLIMKNLEKKILKYIFKKTK